jgi:hypothetical protein
MPSGTRFYTCGDIHSPVSVEAVTTYKNNLGFYADRNYTYIPIPLEMKYYDRTEDELKPLDENQFIDIETPLLEGLQKLQTYPFVLTRDTPSYGYEVKDGELRMVGMVKGANVWEVAENHPEHRERMLDLEEGKRWGIITLADANKRAARAAIYSLYVELESKFATQISNHYPDSEALFEEVNEDGVERWREARDAELEVHISEYMYLYEMKDIINDTPELREAWGFDSKSQFEGHFGGPVKFRNSIMHPARTLVHDQDQFDKMIDRLQRVVEALNVFNSN